MTKPFAIPRAPQTPEHAAHEAQSASDTATIETKHAAHRRIVETYIPTTYVLWVWEACHGRWQPPFQNHLSTDIGAKTVASGL